MSRYLFRAIRAALYLACLGLATPGSPRAAAAADYVIQPDDVLSIQVSGEPQLTKNYPVDEQGQISLERVGRVRVSGLTTRQAQEKLTQELGKYLKLFEVTLYVVGETGGRVLVYGEVGRPGPTRVRPGARLLDVLAEAGPPTANADTRRISVARKTGGKPEVVDLEAVLKDPSLNVEIRAGDTLTIPSRVSQSVRVEGEVRSPGPKPLDGARTAYTAITAAGPTPNADWTRIALRRKGTDTPVMIDLSRVRSGQLKDDYPLQEGDELTVLSRFSGTATIRGEVRAVGEKELNGQTQLWDFLLTAAGGFTERADRRRVQVIRTGSDGKKATRLVDLVAVANGARRSDDPEFEVQAGDVIFVPPGVATLTGEVRSPGEKPLGNTSKLLDFILAAGEGFTERADRTRVQIKRDGKAALTINVTEIASGKRSGDDPELEVLPGDVVFVPNDDIRRFVIVGGVKKPGAYPAQKGMRLIQALAMAEGTSERATRKTIVIARASQIGPDGQLKLAGSPDRTGKAQSEKDLEASGLLVVDLRKLHKGDASQNVPVEPGDQIFVPEEPPPSANGRKPSVFDRLLRLVPLAGLFMGGYYPGGYGY